MKKIIFSLLLSALFINSNAQSLKNFAEKTIAKDSIPEMAFAIITKNKVLIKDVIGHHKSTEENLPSNANINDYFHLGSNTKAITSFVAAKLVEEKKINWDTKFFDLFPELKSKSNPAYLNITLEDLLSHRAKIQPFNTGAEYEKNPKFEGNKQQKRDQFAEYVLTLPPVVSLQSYNYSNAGYSVAALMLEKVTGKSWEDLITKVLKKDLKIDFAFGWPNRNFKNQPFGHWVENGKLIPIEANNGYNLSLAEPAGDISMNMNNYIKFIQLNLQGLSGKDNYLHSTTYKFLHTAKDKYALGWANSTKDNQEISQHAGSDGTFFALTQIDRKNLVAYVVLINSATNEAQTAVNEMLQEMKKYQAATK